MKLILLSGGSGKRLWPLSNSSRSKQFLKLLRSPDLQMESMVQRVWRQLEEAKFSDSARIATCKDQAEAIRHHLGSEVPLIIEPERRDTFPAIALSAAYLHSEEQVDVHEAVCVMPVDCYVEQPFFERVRQLEPLLERTGAGLALIGVEPVYPSQKYGYLVPGHESPKHDEHGWLPVSRFVEKPDEQTARQLLAGKALWNCGVFAFRLGFALSVLERNGWPTAYEELCEQYGRLPATSFDYQVAEKTERIVAVPYEGKWKDIGTWNTLTEEMDSPVIGKGVIDENAKGTHIVNELNIPVVVLGTSDLVVACSPDGVLVADKAATHGVKRLVQSIEGRPMFEEFGWGWRKVLDQSEATAAADHQYLVSKIGVNAGHGLAYIDQRNRNRLWKVLAGEGDFALENRISPVRAGDILVIPPGSKHSLSAVTDMELVEVDTMTGDG